MRVRFCQTIKGLPVSFFASFWMMLIVMLSSGQALAENKSASREIQIIVPNQPGGGLDLLARRIAQSLTTVLARSVVVVNIGGASGNIGTAKAARAEPDGSTLLLTGLGFLVSPLLHSQPGYEPMKDFVPVMKIAAAPSVLLVHRSLRHMGIAELAENSKLVYASAGHGQSSHLAAELLQSRINARWLHVPFKGTAPASRALIAGEVNMMFVPAGSVKPLLATGMAHALAVAHSQRLGFIPDTPTLLELGVKDASFNQWYGIFVPAKTQESQVIQLNQAIAKVIADAEFQSFLQKQGIESAPLNHLEFIRFVREESIRLSTLVKRIGVERVDE